MPRKDIRQEIVRRRKNFLPTLIITLLLWLMVGGVFYFVEPESPGAVPLFFLLVFLALLFTFATIFAHTRRGLIASLGLTLFLLLRYFGVGNLINFLLIAAIGITVEVYFSRR